MAVNVTIEHLPQMHKLLFSYFDYTIFGLMLMISAFIGIYFGFLGKNQSITEYILGGKDMATFPVAVSIIATEISAMDFTGVPGDIYLYGASYWLIMIAVAISGVISYYCYLPVLFKLRLTSCYGYLRLRFDDRLCMFSSMLNILTSLLSMPIIIYVPALAFSQVTNVNIELIIPLVSLVCIFYTTIGGMKAVVWTDTIQFSVLTVAMIVVLILGVVSIGSFRYVFEKSYQGGRLYMWDLDPDPTNRTAVWSPLIGMIFSWVAYIVGGQICNQKFQTLASFASLQRTMIMFIVGLIIIKTLSTLAGLIIYAKYANCDPVKTKIVGSPDQLLPYYIMDVSKNIPGFPGLFIAGIFCAALSTMSTVLNTIPVLIYEDFLKHYLSERTREKYDSLILKGTVVLLGIYSSLMMNIVKYLGTVFALGISMGDMTMGPLLGVFTLGMMVPWANSKGTFIGAVSSLLFMAWMVMGAQYHISQGGVMIPELNTSIANCSSDLKKAISNTTSIEYTPHWFYRISFYYYSLIGTIVCMVIGVIASVLTGGRNQKVDRNLLSPIMYYWLPEDPKEYIKNDSIAMKTMNTDTPDTEVKENSVS